MKSYPIGPDEIFTAYQRRVDKAEKREHEELKSRPKARMPVPPYIWLECPDCGYIRCGSLDDYSGTDLAIETTEDYHHAKKPCEEKCYAEVEKGDAPAGNLDFKKLRDELPF